MDFEELSRIDDREFIEVLLRGRLFEQGFRDDRGMIEAIRRGKKLVPLIEKVLSETVIPSLTKPEVDQASGRLRWHEPWPGVDDLFFSYLALAFENDLGAAFEFLGKLNSTAVMFGIRAAWNFLIPGRPYTARMPPAFYGVIDSAEKSDDCILRMVAARWKASDKSWDVRSN